MAIPTNRDPSNAPAPALRLRPGRRPRVLRGHPWVFAGEVEELLPEVFDGGGVNLRSARGALLGSGIYNSKSKIVWRKFSAKGGTAFDAGYLASAIDRSVSRREETSYRRLVWSEADELPGLVVDQFDDVLVVQALTRAVDEQLEEISRILSDRYAPSEIVLRNDAPSRGYEGLPLEVRTQSGQAFAPRWFDIDGIEFLLDLSGGQKTGFYLDQRLQHNKVAALAEGRRVLDGFCHIGGFALRCARGGAASVLAVDISGKCIEDARANADRNGLMVDFKSANMFDFFTEYRGEPFELIILDPPSFARNRASLDSAMRGYKELNLRALRNLAAGGVLATYSCSQHVARAEFMGMLAAAASDARRPVKVMELTSQPDDHPVCLHFPESEYLKGAILMVGT